MNEPMFKWWGWNVPCFACNSMRNNSDLKIYECKEFDKVIAYFDYAEDTERLAPFGETKYLSVCSRRE